jgi:hypothetical protein
MVIKLDDIKTKADLDAYAAKVLAVYSDPEDPNDFSIPRSVIRPNDKRVAILLDFNISFRSERLEIIVGVYDLDSEGNPIYAKSLKPYEEVIEATEFSYVDIQTGEVTAEEDMDPNKTYVPEFTFYLMYAKTNVMYTLQNQNYIEGVGIDLFKMIARNISISKKLQSA